MACFRRGVRLTIHEIFLLLFLTYRVNAQSGQLQKPHIIMIVADDLGWDDVSFHGSPQIPTPTLDGLANSGVILNNYYVSPMDSPTRAAFLTGKYALNLGLQHDTIHNKQPVGVPLAETLLPEHLRQLGYTTHAVGKWQLGFFAKEFTPTYRGFDSFYGFWTSGQDYFSHVTHDGNFGLDLRRNLDVVFNETGTYGTDLFTREADKVISQHDGSKPLFLYFAQQAVHVGNDNDPLQAPKKYLDRLGYITDERRRTYAAMVSALDESVRQLVTSLKKKGLYDNSVIIFTTDNGAAAGGLDASAGSNYPLRGVKNTLWEGGVRAVGFVHSPLLKKRGRVSTAMIHASDWLPTFYALAGGDVSSLGTIDGFNVWESISNDAQSPRYEILHGLDSLREKKAALRVGDYKMIVHQNRSFYGDWYPRSEALHELDKVPKPKVLKEATVDCTVRHPHPLLYTKAPICNPERKPCLFNIKWDPCEYHNLADFMPNTLKVMVDRLKFYYYKSKPALYPQADESANPNLHGGIWSPWRDKPDIDQTMSDYVYPNSYYDTLKTSFKPQDDHNKPNEFMTGQSSSANGTEQFAPKVASPFHPPSDVQSIIMNAGDFRDRQDAGNDGNAVSAVTPATLATTATRATMASTAEVAITRTPTPPTTATIASTAASFIQLSSAPPAQAVNAVHGNVRPTTFPRTAATSDTEPTANTLATTASPITRAPPVPSIPPAIVEKNKVADVVNYRAQRPSPFRPTGFLKGFFQHQVAGLFKSTSPVSMHKSGGARLVPETVNEVERMVKGRTTARSYPVPFTSTKPVKLPGSFTVPPTAKQAMRNRLFLTKQGSSHVPSDVENVIRQQGFTKHLPSSEVEEISTLPLQPPLVKLTHKPYPHGLKGSIFGTQSNKLNSLPEILDIIDESTVPSAYETGSGQRQIPKIFDIIDEAHNLGEKVKEFSSHREGPIATSKPLTSNDVGSGMGVGLNGLPQGISVFGKLGDEKILTKSHDTKGKGREHIVAKEKPQKGKKAPTVHKFIGNITIDGRHFYVVGTESEELESISTQLEGNRITLHLPKGKKTSNRKSKVKNNKSPESADNKSEIGGVAFNTKPSYSEITDYIDEDEDSERPVNKTLAAHNVTAVATAGNNTKCEKVVQLDTSDNAVVVSSVVIVVIASAMVVGVAVVAMVAVVARHCQNARN